MDVLESAYRTTEDLVGTDPRTGVAVIVARAGQYLTAEDLERYGIPVPRASAARPRKEK
ncbi:hypothetical protein GCM10009760_25900 [Kitasatospora kazusensis]|uniref:Uncharacterized protein n=1 Tax=Kitasatospora kazusensis TaxID=407974 RepID=A0ABN2ZFZ5_9ACTN